MNPQIEMLLDEAENRYLKPEELDTLSQYVSSLPHRLAAYQYLRDHELEVMQPIADQLQAQFPQERSEVLERSLKNALLVLRYCAMAMLLHDPSFVQAQRVDWLAQVARAYHTQPIDQQLYPLLIQQLRKGLNPQQLSWIELHLQTAQNLLLNPQTSPQKIAVP